MHGSVPCKHVERCVTRWAVHWQKERIFVIFIALFGSIVFSYCLGNIISLISQVLVAEALPGSSRAVTVGARPGLALGPRPSGGTRWVAGWGGDDSRTQTDSETGDLARAGV